MIPEEKQLVFKVLCAMLPYEVVVHTDHGDIKLDKNHCGIGMLYYEHYSEEAKKECGYNENDCSIIISGCCYGDVKPYLRPMSSMTEEESSEMSNIISEWHDKELFYLTEEPIPELALSHMNWTISPRLFDWLYAHYLDFRGLIPRELALEAPDGMYKIE